MDGTTVQVYYVKTRKIHHYTFVYHTKSDCKLCYKVDACPYRCESTDMFCANEDLCIKLIFTLIVTSLCLKGAKIKTEKLTILEVLYVLWVSQVAITSKLAV